MTGEAWINTVRFARDFGTVDHLLPEGVTSVRELPHTVFNAVVEALVFLGFDELAPEDRPPKRIWRDGKKLNAWFDEVRRRWKGDRGGEIDDPVENPAARDLIVG